MEPPSPLLDPANPAVSSDTSATNRRCRSCVGTQGCEEFGRLFARGWLLEVGCGGIEGHGETVGGRLHG
jgi:hypothetical protein